MNQSSPPQRGRPKTLDRDHILRTALLEYWSKGPAKVSVNDLCKLTGASKPGIYREFGSDDGLKRSVLDAYQALAVDPLIAIFGQDQPAKDTLDAAQAFMTQDRAQQGIPDGCLFVTMRSQAEHMGAATTDRLHTMRQALFDAFCAWAKRGVTRGDIRDLPPVAIAHFLDAQHGGAMRMLKEGVHRDMVATVLDVAFKTILSPPRTSAR